jgi:hypothetical protein
LSGNDCLLGRIHDLLVDRDAGLECQAEWDHMCTMTDSTLKKKNSFRSGADGVVADEPRGV